MTEVEFRAAGEADVEAVVALVESAYRGPSSATGWTTEAHLLDGRRTDAAQVRALLGRPASVVILAEMPAIDGSGPAIVGCCHVAARADGAASFGLFAVSPTRQGAGLGRALIGQAGRMAAAWGCRELRMTVICQRDDLIAWYHRLGFESTGEREPFPYGDERFGRPRRDDLEFVVLTGPVSGLVPEGG